MRFQLAALFLQALAIDGLHGGCRRMPFALARCQHGGGAGQHRCAACALSPAWRTCCADAARAGVGRIGLRGRLAGLGKQLIPQLPRLRQRLPVSVCGQPLASRFLCRLRGLLALLQRLQCGARRIVGLVGRQRAIIAWRCAGKWAATPASSALAWSSRSRLALRRLLRLQDASRLQAGARLLCLAGHGLRRLQA